jgi:polyphosphate kinase
VSSNLDEFFEVRAEPHLEAYRAGDVKGEATVESFLRLASVANSLVERQYSLYNDVLTPAFARHGIHLISHGERNAVQRQWVKAYFEREVQPLLIPVGLDPAHPFPQVANKSLNFIVRLGGPDAFGRSNEIAIVKGVAAPDPDACGCFLGQTPVCVAVECHPGASGGVV